MLERDLFDYFISDDILLSETLRRVIYESIKRTLDNVEVYLKDKNIKIDRRDMESFVLK